MSVSNTTKRVREIRRKTRRKFSSEEKIRIVLEGLRGECSIAELCRREGINANLYYRWSKDFLEAGKRRLAGDTVREANSDGTTHVIFEPLDFIARLAALVPRPRVNLTRYHGVFAPNSKLRALVTPARRGKGRKAQTSEQASDQTPAERRVSMTGFCSCKTGIHAIPGNNLGTALETCVPHRYRNLLRMRRCGQGHRLY